ncbi:MAG: ABC transporter ATP-binding protein [Rhodoferax sp.]|nr:ABC transporter ATP-binding protein [Rhodoferax sp.]
MFLDLMGVEVSHAASAKPTVQAVSLGLRAGEIGVLTGPSGCGKTTLLRAIAGLETVCAGEIRLAGTVVSSQRVHVAAEQRRVGMVFQDYALFPHMSVRDNVAFGLRQIPKGQKDQRIAEVLGLVGMAAYATRFPHALSGGQQQRVALARALAPKPHLLLLDEPFSNLDVEMRERLALEVRSILKEAHTTALLVTHDQQEAFAMGDQVGVMSLGQLDQWADGYTIYHRPASRFVAGFIGHGMFASARYLERDGAPWLATPLGAFGPTAAPTASSASASGECDMLVRADDVTLDPNSPIRAQLEQINFRGSEFIYTLRLASGDRVMASVLKHQGHVVGDTVGIRAELDHVVTFPRVD